MFERCKLIVPKNENLLGIFLHSLCLEVSEEMEWQDEDCLSL